MARTLAQKLGYAPGQRACLVDAPAGYADLFEGPLAGVTFVEDPARGPLDLVHVFAAAYAGLPETLAYYRRQVEPAGAIWVSWPKKSSGVTSDVDGDAIRKAAFPLGLVDVKVCSVDATWSALKLVVRRSER